MKAQISGKLVPSGISNVAIVSVHSEKTLMKKMIMIITRKMVPITGRARSFLLVFKKQNREEGETD